MRGKMCGNRVQNEAKPATNREPEIQCFPGTSSLLLYGIAPVNGLITQGLAVQIRPPATFRTRQTVGGVLICRLIACTTHEGNWNENHDPTLKEGACRGGKL